MTDIAMPRPTRTTARLGTASTVAVAIPVVVAQLMGDGQRVLANPAQWWSAYLVFLIVLVAIAEELPRPPTPTQDRAALVVLVITGLLAVAAAPGYGFSVVLPIVAATAAAHIVSLRATVAVVVLQAVAIGGVSLTTPGVSASEAILQGTVWAGFMGFAVVTVEAGARQASARERQAVLNAELATANERLATANAELEAAQRLLAASVRTEERLRISRDLHDLIGHQLTALTLQLEAAGHRGAGAATDNVQRSSAIARALLDDVRHVVGQLREHTDHGPTTQHDPTARTTELAGSTLAGALRDAVDGVASPDVSLEVDTASLPADPERAVALLRVVQEVVTNAARHADADHLWIRVVADDDGVALLARDDGTGADPIVPGHGLTGMRERLAAVGGSLHAWSPPDSGFHLRATIPTTTHGP